MQILYANRVQWSSRHSYRFSTESSSPHQIVPPLPFTLPRSLVAYSALDVVVDDEVKLLLREPVVLRTFPREVFILETKPSSFLTGGSRSCATAWKAAILVAVATSCDPPAWRAAILAALQPSAGYHRILQSPPGRDGVPPPSAPQPPVVARGACCPHKDVHSLQTVDFEARVVGMAQRHSLQTMKPV